MDRRGEWLVPPAPREEGPYSHLTSINKYRGVYANLGESFNLAILLESRYDMSKKHLKNPKIPARIVRQRFQHAFVLSKKRGFQVYNSTWNERTPGKRAHLSFKNITPDVQDYLSGLTNRLPWLKDAAQREARELAAVEKTKELLLEWLHSHHPEALVYQDRCFQHLVAFICYPMLRDFLQPEVRAINLGSAYTPALKRTNFKDAVQEITGHQTRIVTRRVGERLQDLGNTGLNPLALLIATWCKGYVTVDHMQEILSWPETLHETQWRAGHERYTANADFTRKMRRFLKKMPAAKIVRFLASIREDPDGGKQRLLEDSVRMMGDYGIDPPEFQTVEQLHDRLIPLFNRVYNRGRRDVMVPEKAIKPSKKWSKLQDQQAGQFRIKLPETNKEVGAWGQEMHHCIGGYAEEMVNGKLLLLALYHGEKLTYNIAINSRGRVRDFRGKYNAVPAPEHRLQILSYLVDQGIVDDEELEMPIPQHPQAQLLDEGAAQPIVHW